jgi:hypothetical protein
MSRQCKLMFVMVVLASLVFFTGLQQAPADTLLFSYGLPTQNLNGSPPPANRSNGSPGGYPTYTESPSSYLIEGDSFTIGSSGQQYYLTTGTLYMIYGAAGGPTDTTSISTDNFPSLTLWAGVAGDIHPVSTTYTVTRDYYSNDENFQRGGTGEWRGIWRIDFTLNADIEGGQKYYYFLDGLFQNDSGQYQAPNLLAANPSLGGVTPVGHTDDPMQYYDIDSGDITLAGTSLPSGYAKANIEIYGSQVPLPGTLLLLGSGLFGLIGLRRLRKN